MTPLDSLCTAPFHELPDVARARVLNRLADTELFHDQNTLSHRRRNQNNAFSGASLRTMQLVPMTMTVPMTDW